MPFGPCEICSGTTVPWHLKHGGHVDRCRVCGHVRRTLTDAPGNHRDAAYGGDPSMDSARTALTYRRLRATGRPASVFEIGFGSGALLRRFHDDGATIAGVDPDQLGVGLDEVVRREATLWHGTMEDVPDGAVAADLVVGVHVIEHVTDPMLTVHKAASLLSESGRLVLLTPAGDSWGLSTFGSAWWMLEDPTHVRFFTEDSLTRMARKAGLTNIRVERMVVDSLSVDVASLVRTARPPGPAGALASSPVRLASLASSPVVAGLRVVAPRTRATLCLTADRGAR